MHLVTSDIDRGCGRRKEGGLYACVPSGPNGRPLEEFIIDPALPWPHGPFQGCQFYERSDGTLDLILWVGAESYPFFPDFAEEGRHHGFSKRVPLGKDADYSRLVPYQSRILLVHPKGSITQPYELRGIDKGTVPGIQRPDPHPTRDCNHPLQRTPEITSCTFALWDLSAIEPVKDLHTVAFSDHLTQATIDTPSIQYTVNSPVWAPSEPEYTPAIVLALPFSHFEYVNPEGTLPDQHASKLGDMIRFTEVTPT